MTAGGVPNHFHPCKAIFASWQQAGHKPGLSLSKARKSLSHMPALDRAAMLAPHRKTSNPAKRMQPRAIAEDVRVHGVRKDRSRTSLLPADGRGNERAVWFGWSLCLSHHRSVLVSSKVRALYGYARAIRTSDATLQPAKHDPRMPHPAKVNSVPG